LKIANGRGAWGAEKHSGTQNPTLLACTFQPVVSCKIPERKTMFSTASVDNPGLVCKSAHAGSIPASASTFESPADYGLRGFFMAAIWRITSAIFGIASAIVSAFCLIEVSIVA